MNQAVQTGKKKFPLTAKIAVVVVVALIAIFGYLFARMMMAQSSMEPLVTGEYAPGICAVKDRYVNAWLMEGADGYLMIDAGIDADNMAAALTELQIDPADVKTILLTHSDADHTGALSLFEEAVVYLPRDEVQMVDGTTARKFNFIKNSLKPGYRVLRVGEILETEGRRIECIGTPGHTPGSMSYLIDGAYLFTGDTLRLRDGKIDLFNSFFNMDDALQQESIRLLSEYPYGKSDMPQYIFTGHYGYAEDAVTLLQAWKDAQN